MPRYHIATTGAVGAKLALIRLLARVRPLVCREVIASAKHLLALAALVRLEARVEPRVARQHVRARKGTPALIAQVTLQTLALLALRCCGRACV